MIRKAIKSDIESLIQYYKMFDENGVNLFKETPFTNVFVYEKDRKVVGFIRYSLIYNRAEIDYIYVEEAYRNQCIATQLMDFCIEDAITHGCENITLEVNENNKAGLGLYESFGFKKASVRPKYYKGEDGLLMIRELSAHE